MFLFYCSLLAFWQMQMQLQQQTSSAINPGYKVVSTFQVSGDQANCLKLLSDMRPCSNDIVGFLLKTQNNLHPDCCRAISTLSNNCLPTMLKSFGFTTVVHNTLQGHCDAAPLAGSYPPFAN
jgi:hypothetical protein